MWPAVMVLWTGEIEVSISPMQGPLPSGISGLAESGDGGLWAVAERQRPRLLQLDADGQRVVRQAPVLRVPRGFDLESVDWLDDQTLVFGAEHPLRGQAAVLLAEWDGTRARVVRTWPVGKGGLKESVMPNRGFEGICVGDTHIAVASETWIETERGPVAPLYLIARSGLDWHRPTVERTVHIPLPEGAALSALDCGTSGQISAIVRGRRDGGYQRALVRLSVDDDTVEIFPLGDVLEPHNLEGLISDPGGWRAISDAPTGEAVWVDLRLR